MAIKKYLILLRLQKKSSKSKWSDSSELEINFEWIINFDIIYKFNWSVKNFLVQVRLWRDCMWIFKKEKKKYYNYK